MEGTAVIQDIHDQTKPGQILVVDDNDDLREIISIALTHEGYEVRQARNGKVALALLAEASADMVITDLVMPECDGYELMSAIRSRYPETRIIAISGEVVSGSNVNLLSAAKHLGAHVTLIKPFPLAVLKVTVNNLLQEQR